MGRAFLNAPQSAVAVSALQALAFGVDWLRAELALCLPIVEEDLRMQLVQRREGCRAGFEEQCGVDLFGEFAALVPRLTNVQPEPGLDPIRWTV